MIRKFIAVVLCMCSSLAAAETKQLNVVGIIPGVTTEEAVKAASTKQEGKVIYLDIGGYSLPCTSGFIGSVLGYLNCLTGEEFTEASNFDIHETLVKGFTKKFGKPDENNSTPGRNMIGVEYEANTVSWADKKGNLLILMSISDQVDQGSITLFSNAQIKKMNGEAARKEKARKF